MGGFDIQHFIITISVLIMAITIHEFSHAFVSDRLGDPTPRREGRLSLLPPDHLDLFGTIMMIVSTISGFGIGWGKPVHTDPSNFRNPRRDMGISALAGPVSNLLQAVVFAFILRVAISTSPPSGPVLQFLLVGVVINLSLAFFNLIPIAPLDGSWVLTALLPKQMAIAYRSWMISYGPLIFLAIIFLFRGLIGKIIGPPVLFCLHILLPSLTPGLG